MWDKDAGQICPEIHYRNAGDGIENTACYGADGRVVLPDEIGGIKVTGIAAYAFAANRQYEREDEQVWRNEEFFPGGELTRLCGSTVTEIWLPTGVTELGRYAFYRCRNLRRLILTDSLPDIGGGVFTGCRLSEVEIYFFRGERSCLKSILDEMRYTIRATLRYCGEAGQAAARVVFPEHYEEAVENTPARILYTQHHGAGGYYRQCFYDRKLDYKKYDELLYRMEAEEQPDVAAKLALDRLRYPYALTQEARESYLDYVKRHIVEAADDLTEREDIDGLRFLAREGLITENALEDAIEKAAKEKRTEVLSFLMDEKHKRYPKKRKRFEL